MINPTVHSMDNSWKEKLACKLISQPYQDKDWLFDQYVTRKKSLHQIRKEFGWGINTIKRWLKFYEIPTREKDDPIVLEQQAYRLTRNDWKGRR